MHVHSRCGDARDALWQVYFGRPAESPEFLCADEVAPVLVASVLDEDGSVLEALAGPEGLQNGVHNVQQTGLAGSRNAVHVPELSLGRDGLEGGDGVVHVEEGPELEPVALEERGPACPDARQHGGRDFSRCCRWPMTLLHLATSMGMRKQRAWVWAMRSAPPLLAA